MEKKYELVTKIIEELALENPHITKEQIAKARSMYNGDPRSIEIIRAELEAYSAEIEERESKKTAERSKIDMKPADIKIAAPTPMPTEARHPMTAISSPSPEMLDSLRAELPGEDRLSELQSMMDDTLGTQANSNSSEINYQGSKDQAKVLVKKQAPDSSDGSESPTGNDGGYGNVPALLSLTIIFSIVTIIIAFFTIIAK